MSLKVEIKRGEKIIAEGKASGPTRNSDGSTEIFVFDLKVPVAGYLTLVLTDDQGNSQQFQNCQGRGWSNGQSSFVTIEAPNRVSELSLDFSVVADADLETVRQRLLSLFRSSPEKVRRVDVTFHEKGVAGAAGCVKQHPPVYQDDDLNDLARRVAESIVEYTRGKDGRLYRGATVAIFRT